MLHFNSIVIWITWCATDNFRGGTAAINIHDFRLFVIAGFWKTTQSARFPHWVFLGYIHWCFCKFLLFFSSCWADSDLCGFDVLWVTESSSVKGSCLTTLSAGYTMMPYVGGCRSWTGCKSFSCYPIFRTLEETQQTLIVIMQHFFFCVLQCKGVSRPFNFKHLYHFSDMEGNQIESVGEVTFSSCNMLTVL